MVAVVAALSALATSAQTSRNLPNSTLQGCLKWGLFELGFASGMRFVFGLLSRLMGLRL
jgi:hypothetical protein